MLGYSESYQASRNDKERARARDPTIHIIEPIWEQFAALLAEREVFPPLGCHRSRIPDRVIFEKLVQVLVFGCAYRRIADGSCSATTLRDRRDEWIELGAMDALREMALEAYDRIVGLELPDVAVDCCITKALAAARRPEEARWTAGSGVPNALWRWTQKASPWAPSPLRQTATTRRCWPRPSTRWHRLWESCPRVPASIWIAATTPRPPTSG